jgi:hypothetical protein
MKWRVECATKGHEGRMRESRLRTLAGYRLEKSGTHHAPLAQDRDDRADVEEFHSAARCPQVGDAQPSLLGIAGFPVWVSTSTLGG